MKPPAPVTHTLFAAAAAAIAFWFSAAADEENCRSRVVDDRSSPERSDVVIVTVFFYFISRASQETVIYIRKKNKAQSEWNPRKSGLIVLYKRKFYTGVIVAELSEIAHLRRRSFSTRL